MAGIGAGVGWAVLAHHLMVTTAVSVPKAAGAAGAIGGLLALVGLVYYVFLRGSGPVADSSDSVEQGIRIARSRSTSSIARMVQFLSGTSTTAQDVDVSVFAPAWAPPRQEIVIQVIFHTPERQAEAELRALKVDSTAEHLAAVPLQLQVRQGDQLKATIECDDLYQAAPVQVASWNGRLICMHFPAVLPDFADGKMLRPKLRVFVNGIPAGILMFKLAITPGELMARQTVVNDKAKAFRRPFLSYASEDRVSVLRAAQLLGALRMQFFQDIVSLSPGDRWEQKLYAEIDNCDLFLLFWSTHARDSRWVIMEAEYALKRAKKNPLGDSLEIVPILLEGPPPPTPPASLVEIHFNDPLRHVIFAEELLARQTQSV